MNSRRRRPVYRFHAVRLLPEHSAGVRRAGASTFQALHEALRCKEIWVAGAHFFQDPEEDLPKDFAARRVENYAELRKPLDPRDFIAELETEMRAELEALDAALPKLDWAPFMVEVE
ncbi:hypothetical protein [Nonomuraea diastatica]|uniref:Uncharacterized protein n=1 Tax=Nonomuraea diastatica TaxID=1848329 RepID=A0A4R4WUB4_9ACTN|nr:hypothetical protein [Nonomuraea diastatica]TDD21226.1 hypothetical protein E1294_15365 [Nonomuraea diastatica]